MFQNDCGNRHSRSVNVAVLHHPTRHCCGTDYRLWFECGNRPWERSLGITTCISLPDRYRFCEKFIVRHSLEKQMVSILVTKTDESDWNWQKEGDVKDCWTVKSSSGGAKPTSPQDHFFLWNLSSNQPVGTLPAHFSENQSVSQIFPTARPLWMTFGQPGIVIPIPQQKWAAWIDKGHYCEAVERLSRKFSNSTLYTSVGGSLCRPPGMVTKRFGPRAAPNNFSPSVYGTISSASPWNCNKW